jgi:hypothetical protein
MSEYRGGYKTEVARFELVSYERTEYIEYLKTHNLIDLEGGDYTYYYPETLDLGRVKVSLENTEWKFQWENNRG